MKFFIETLGCRLNQAESQELAGKLLAAGWRETENPAQADLIVLNTCVVTQKAEKETRQAIRRLRRENTKAKLVVAGCWVDMVRKFGGLVPKGIDQMVRNRDKWRGLKNLRIYLPRGKAGEFKNLGVKIHQIKNRGLIKVQSGCSNHCSYCLPALVRSELVSIPARKVVTRIKRALRQGALEIVLTGQNISQYYDRNADWIALLAKILKETDVPLLRLGSVNPVFDPRRFVAVYQKWGEGRLARHLHLSFQSGSGRILKLMGRNYTTGQFAKIVDVLRRGISGVNITTDIIVGFPGETEVDFEKTLSFVKKIGFGKIHIFRYSPRAGTVAAEMPNQIDEKNKKIRARKLARLEEELRQEFWQSQIGQKAKAIIWPDGRGLTDNYIPVAHRFLVGQKRSVLRRGKFVKIADGLVYFE